MPAERAKRLAQSKARDRRERVERDRHAIGLMRLGGAACGEAPASRQLPVHRRRTRTTSAPAQKRALCTRPRLAGPTGSKNVVQPLPCQRGLPAAMQRLHCSGDQHRLAAVPALWRSSWPHARALLSVYGSRPAGSGRTRRHAPRPESSSCGQRMQQPLRAVQQARGHDTGAC
eukprot:scaffold1316_cov130-Isochrysis_galbana.AAC.8